MTGTLGKAQRREVGWCGRGKGYCNLPTVVGCLMLVLAFKEHMAEHTSSVHGRHDKALCEFYLLWLMITLLLLREKHPNPMPCEPMSHMSGHWSLTQLTSCLAGGS